MTPDEIQLLSESVESSNKLRYDWMRNLVLLASGALTVIVSLYSEKQPAGMPLICMKVAWVSLGIGILLGAVTLHGEVWSSGEMAKRLAERLSEPHHDNITIHVKMPFRYRASATICYLSLVCAVISFVFYALTR